MNSLQKLRKNTGLSQQALADFLGVSRSLISLVEKGLRELPKEAAIKLAEIEKVIGKNDFTGKTDTAVLNDKENKELRDYHQMKIDDYLYKAEGLKRNFVAISQERDKFEAKHKLVKGLAKNNPKTGKKKFVHAWTEYHGQESSEKLSKYFSTMEMLEYDIEALMGYVAVHQKILKKII